jgi:alkylhydroperoxidase/carboxymuconolactone decarboxylase family protein YurZ
MSTPALTEILRDADVEALRNEFRKDPAALVELISTTIPRMWSGARELTLGVMDTFSRMSGTAAKDGALSLDQKEREMVVLALLTARGGGYPLGLHIYISLLLGITIEEMLDIILLTGIYAGVPEMTQAYRDVARTLEQLRIAARGGRSACTVAAINERLGGALR